MNNNETMIVKEIPMDEIYSDSDFNCREHLTPFDVADLAKSIESVGLQQPIAVQPYVAVSPFKFRIVLGHRRHKAFQALKRTSIPCIIKEGLTDFQARVLNLKENLQRKNLNMMEEAHALDKFKRAGYTIKEVADVLNVSSGYVQVRFAALQLPEEIQQAVAGGFFTQEQVKDVASLKTRDEQIEAAKAIKESRLKGEKRAIKVKSVKKNPFAKKQRKREELFEMIEHIIDTLGPGLATRALAWAAGEISDVDLYANIKEVCEDEGITYFAPVGSSSILSG